MKQIKFRVWNGKRRQYFHGGGNISLSLCGRPMWQFGFDAPEFLSLEEAKDYLIEQFTGFTDKNGRDIYEGDRIAAGEIQGYVEWDDETGQWWSVPDSTRPNAPLYHDTKGIEVIGRVHDD